ncbi:M48 family metallopeptidase [Cupriavidus sp. AU9028]|uniref:M48 family metallopeptidase n=1 Tax=Cupriavidus sp. AU9028 TaxID=2871157 RepID=UPI001C986203|nr:SprT family zinc-dependent metalloprotease [Cupriavidus sp. AU9028]MBY4898897.1 M48 family metallopeptidase [Cupriavidus sp. AU9028]
MARPGSDSMDRQMELPLLDAGPLPDAAGNRGHGPAVPADEPPARHWPPVHANSRRLQLGERALHYTLKRSPRRTIGFTIDDRGLTVAAPRWVTVGDIESAIGQKQRWIFTKLAEWQRRDAQRVLPALQWRDGATVPFLGKPVTLRLPSPTGTLLFDALTGTLHLALPDQADEQQIRDRVQAWLQTQARRLFAERLDVYAAKLGVRHKAFALSSANTRWGSCTADGKIRLNWRLLHFPLSVIDYVAAHELAHLKEMNHGPRFWQTVASIFPEFEQARATLKADARDTVPAY